MEAILERLQIILQKVENLQENNHELNRVLLKKDSEINRLKQLLDIQNHSIKELENKLKIKRIADGITGEKDENASSRDIKFKINEMIKEVDKVINLMHQQ